MNPARANARAVAALEAAWVALCEEAGYRSLNIAHLGERRRYEASLDAAIAANESNLRALIAAAMKDARDHYAEGILAAVERAIASPRQAP